MAFLRPDIASVIAHMPPVVAEVQQHGRGVLAKAEAAFAAHNRPGGHEVVGEKQDTDYLISLEGPAPVSVEYGHGAYTTERDGKIVEVGASQGLHILGKAADL
jgi:hypothetical protein